MHMPIGTRQNLVPAKERVFRTITLPKIYKQPAPNYVPPRATLRPSDLGGAKALPGEAGLDEAAAMARGTALHRLLEHLPALPQSEWEDRAEVLARHEDWAELLEEARAVLTAPDLANIFAPDALAEVAVTADLGTDRLHGVIDRLIVTEDRVLAVDFKSNATVPGRPEDCPEGLLRQMGAYARALAQIYPDRQIDTALLWTRTATLMPLPHALVSQACERATFQRLEP